MRTTLPAMTPAEAHDALYGHAARHEWLEMEENETAVACEPEPDVTAAKFQPRVIMHERLIRDEARRRQQRTKLPRREGHQDPDGIDIT